MFVFNTYTRTMPRSIHVPYIVLSSRDSHHEITANVERILAGASINLFYSIAHAANVAEAESSDASQKEKQLLVLACRQGPSPVPEKDNIVILNLLLRDPFNSFLSRHFLTSTRGKHFRD
jgi:hypothetical protein